jgi:prepilin-type N-terminal cleavage/methylation domain-containing protein
MSLGFSMYDLRNVAPLNATRTSRAFGGSLQAFTMIELLVALAISAIVLTAIGTLFFGALHLRLKASDAAELTLPVDRTMAVMKNDLRGIVPPGMLAGPMGSDAVPVGITEQPLLELYTDSGVVGEDAPWGDVQKVDYLLRSPATRNSGPGQDLIRAVTRNLLPSGIVMPDQQALLSGVQTLKFTYYDGTNWIDTWSTTLSNAPVAIKVNIDFATSKTDANFKFPIEFLVPVTSWANTNSITNAISN